MIKTAEHLTTRVRHILTIAPEKVDSTTENLPLEKPATPQRSFTVEASDIPVFNPPVANFINLAFAYVAGRNDTGASKTLNFEVLKNGVFYQNNSAGINNGNYGSFSIYAYDVQIGDVFDFYVWASDENVQLFKCGFIMAPSQIRPQNNKVLKNLRFDNWIDAPAFAGQSRYVPYHTWQMGATEFYFQPYNSSETILAGSWWSGADSYILRMYYGDNRYRDGKGYWTNIACPYVYANRLPRLIEYDIVETHKGD